MATFQGKQVKVTEIKRGEAGFDEKTPKVRIKGEDGVEQTVNKTQVEGA
jgi:hypothetical protein